MNPSVNGVIKDRAGHHTVVAIVEDKPGVLMRVSSLFRRRGFNIESLTVGHSESEGLSRMTIVVDGASAPIEQVEKQLYKLIEVVKRSVHEWQGNDEPQDDQTMVVVKRQ